MEGRRRKAQGAGLEVKNKTSFFLKSTIRNPKSEIERLAPRNYAFGPLPGALTINTGTHEERTIFSATLPITQRLTPERP